MSEAIKVSSKVLEGLEAVRSSGITNMFDMRAVKKIADEMGYDETYEWLDAVDRRTYAAGIMNGFEADA